MFLYFKTEGGVDEAKFIAPKVLRFLREPYCLGVTVLDSSGRLVAVIAVADGDLNCMA